MVDALLPATDAPLGNICQRCKWWDDRHIAKGGATICRRHAPRPKTTRSEEDPDTGVGTSYWPITEYDDWCGEWEAANA